MMAIFSFLSSSANFVCRASGHHWGGSQWSSYLQPVVFELQISIGGVWTNPPEATTSPCPRSPRPAYQFSGFPWRARSKESYPNHNKVKLYIESYANHFGLTDCILFNSKALSIDYIGSSDEDLLSWTLWGDSGHAFSPKGRWNINVQDTQLQSTNEYEVEFVVVCIGGFKNAPKLPSFPLNKGPDVFKGKVVHAKEYLALDDVVAFDMVDGKRVVIVVAQKTAFDIAAQCQRKRFVRRLPKGVEAGSIKLEQSTHWHFSESGVIVRSEDAYVPADVIILATAYDGDHRLSSMFKSPTLQKLILSSSCGETRLYKDCLHPRIPQLAIMATAQGFCNIYTSETRAGG